MNDQATKVVSKKFEALKASFPGVFDKLETQLPYMTKDQALGAFRDIQEKHPDTKSLPVSVLDPFFYEHHGATALEKEGEKETGAKKQEKPRTMYLAHAGLEEDKLKRERELFLKNPEKTKRVLLYESVGRMAKTMTDCVLNGEEIPKDLFSSSVRRTVIAHYVAQDDPSYALSERAVFNQWCLEHNAAFDSDEAKKHSKTSEFRHAVDKRFVNKQQPTGEINLAMMVGLIVDKKNELETTLVRNPIDGLIVSVANGRYPAKIGKIKPETKTIAASGTKELNRRKFLFFPTHPKPAPIKTGEDQKKMLVCLAENFQTRILEYAKKTQFRMLLEKYNIALNSSNKITSTTDLIPSGSHASEATVWKDLFSRRRFPIIQQTEGAMRIGFVGKVNGIAETIRRKRRLQAAKANGLGSPEKIAMDVLKKIASPISSPLTSPWKLAIIIPILIMLLVLFIIPGGTGFSTTLDDLTEVGGGTGTSSSISLTKTDNVNGKMNTGQNVIFTLTVNYSNVTGPITVTDPIPDNTSYVPNSCTPSNKCQFAKDSRGKDTVTWTINPFAATTQSSNQAASQPTDSATLANWLNKKLSEEAGHDGFKGMGQAFAQLSTQYNIPIELALGQFHVETQWATDGIKHNNPGNIKCSTDNCKNWLGVIDTSPAGYSVFPTLEKGIEAYFKLLSGDTYKNALNAFITTSNSQPIIHIYYAWAASGCAGGCPTETQYVEEVRGVVSNLRTAAANDGIVLPVTSNSASAPVTSGTTTLSLTLTAASNNAYIVNKATASFSGVSPQEGCDIVTIGAPTSSQPQCLDNSISITGDRAFPVRGITVYDIVKYRKPLNSRAENDDSGGFFNKRKTHWHAGLDISGRTQASMETGTWYIVSATKGTVERIHTGCVKGDLNCGGKAGNAVWVTGPDGLRFSYFHLLSVSVQPGDVVQAGQVLGVAGDTGNSSAVHLHFEIRPYSNLYYAYDPLPWLMDGSLKDYRKVQ
jgi:uncharacterized repeat protein (TIGR01451 family)